MATKPRNMHIDTSACTVVCYPLQLVDYLKHRGRQKVPFGSNYSMLTLAKVLAIIYSMGLDETARFCFLERSARRVYEL